MAGNPNSGQGRQNGGTPRDKVESAASQAQGAAEHATNRIKEGLGAARGEAEARYRQAEGSIARNPLPSVLIGFGLGVGIGLALTAALTRREETWAEKYLPDSMRNLPDQIRRSGVPQHLRQASTRVQEKVREAQIPENLQEQFSQLSASLKDLPGLLSKYLPGR